MNDKEAPQLIKTVYAKMLKGLQTNSEEIKEEALEILTEIFKKFGQLLLKNPNLVPKDDLLKVLCDHLSASNKNICKKTTNCIGYFAVILNKK